METYRFTQPTSVLLVDADRETLTELHRVLTRRQIRVQSAISGLQALRALEQVTVAAIVADHRAPTAGGVWLLGEVQSQYPQVRRILMGDCEQEQIQEHIDSGLIETFLPKPVNVDELVFELLEEPTKTPRASPGDE